VFTAVLGCGLVLTYEARSFVPTTGEWVPCRRHGYCAVIRRGRARATRSRLRDGTRARPREQHELLDWLQACPVATIAAPRRQRFTLRLISEAERDGLVAVDPATSTSRCSSADIRHLAHPLCIQYGRRQPSPTLRDQRGRRRLSWSVGQCQRPPTATRSNRRIANRGRHWSPHRATRTPRKGQASPQRLGQVGNGTCYRASDPRSRRAKAEGSAQGGIGSSEIYVSRSFVTRRTLDHATGASSRGTCLRLLARRLWREWPLDRGGGCLRVSRLHLWHGRAELGG
jgi:hypothetical protein